MGKLRMAVCGLVLLAVPLADVPAAAESAQELYRLYCVQCHGTQGNGEGINQTHGGLAVSPRNHTATLEMSKLSDADLRLVIAKGGDATQKSELMPPFEHTLTGAEIDALVRYLRVLCTCEGKK
ncbi:MAG: cytochrome c [Candidatus Lambdaproteobacteria bacterium]|nr:cytochrome c [Candidatus Lambdaproteobacteria bacterium]